MESMCFIIVIIVAIIYISNNVSVQYAREACFEKELTFWYHIKNARYNINQFVWIDESHVNDRCINRKFGYALRGKRAVFQYIFSRGVRYTVTAALDRYGILDYIILKGIYCIIFFSN